MSNRQPLTPQEREKMRLIFASMGTRQLDDRELIFPFLFDGISRLDRDDPEDEKLATTYNDLIIQALYETIPHPSLSHHGADRFRRADGGHNNVNLPDMGRAGTPYARNFQGQTAFPPNALPPASEVFDKLLAAPQGQERDRHPGGNSAMTFAFASIVTHSIFRTDPSDWGINNTSSYLDLSPLYGSNQEEQDAVRVKDGRGLLYPDTFSESRLVFLPPAAGALLVVWNRNHNYIAQELLKRNERLRWFDPPPKDKAQLQDEEIFQTARLINCGSFMSVILGDYVSGFLGLPRNGNSWAMDPFNKFNRKDGKPVGRGEGNHSSIEFNLLYRWHTVTSKEEEDWTATLLGKLYPNKKPEELNLSDFYDGLGRLRKGTAHPDLNVHPDPSKRVFGGMKRKPDGRFRDADLAKILHDATESYAHRYGAHGTPSVLRVIEIMAIEQARVWGTCSMNEFRTALGLKPFEKFEDWNDDTHVVKVAKELYKDINNLELYAGLHAEKAMPLAAGSGLCAGYTITRAILSDAIALVRGDRFYTTDFTPNNLTKWGFEDVKRDEDNYAFGAYLPKLLMRALPDHYPTRSIYTLFPFFHPDQTVENLKKLGKLIDYLQGRPQGINRD